MKSIYIFIIFGIVALAQIFVPMQMILNNEKTIDSGVAYRFKTRPIDPTDPFRGKYITLDYEMNHFYTTDSTYVGGEEIYVYIKNDDKGFAEVSQISKIPLVAQEDYVKAKVTYSHNGSVSFQLPFNIFYMEETKAYDAEVAYRTANRDTIINNVYALVYIKGDTVVLNEVFIDDVPIKEYVDK